TARTMARCSPAVLGVGTGLAGFFVAPCVGGQIGESELIAAMDAALHLPGVSNSWTMPVRGRVDMLSTGLRSAIRVKVTGPDPVGLEQLGARIASVLREMPDTRSAFAERNNGGRYIDIPVGPRQTGSPWSQRCRSAGIGRPIHRRRPGDRDRGWPRSI